MKLTKYEHSCLILTKGDATLVIDPGTFTTPLSDVDGVVAIVITHEHPDHWTPEQLTRLLDRNPNARILGPAGVAAAAAGFTVETVTGGDTVEVGPFTLAFFGEKHAVIHSSIPIVDNVGVLVNDRYYYGGDSYTQPDRSVEVLAAPCGAPWLTIGDAMDYVLAVAPRRAFAVHDAPLSEFGIGMHRARLRWATEQGGGEFVELEPGDVLTI